jgi:hypothetical protein
MHLFAVHVYLKLKDAILEKILLRVWIYLSYKVRSHGDKVCKVCKFVSLSPDWGRKNEKASECKCESLIRKTLREVSLIAQRRSRRSQQTHNCNIMGVFYSACTVLACLGFRWETERIEVQRFFSRSHTRKSNSSFLSDNASYYQPRLEPFQLAASAPNNSIQAQLLAQK